MAVDARVPVQREAAMVSRDEPRIGKEPLIRPLPLVLLDDPLEYISADHTRQRCIADALRRFGVKRMADRSEAETVVTFLGQDLPLHHQDEEEDLFPAVRRRALPIDDLAPILDQLCQDHSRAMPMVATIIDALSRNLAIDPVAMSKPICKTLLAYADGERRHLAIENGVVLVIARIRLTGKDLRAISRSMKARRGVTI